eukprot:TRINITY_DN1053_c0_g1_i4.p1 TRINITY_DN1053_c0_g1~~TRINITY_DN1053_c0_g1_i4.p1  ORF type:complete len:186 (-),score=22.66 TRINITY_DN1053_c0_g1_i4:105-662(-)
MLQFFKGVAHIHSKCIIHRDLKPENVLVTYEGKVKLCDFGMARHLKFSDQLYTRGVITLNYRPPEILFEAPEYSNSADVWSCGCILAEVLKGRELFRVNNANDLCKEMFRILGTPEEDIWENLEWMNPFGDSLPVSIGNCLEKELIGVSEEGIDLLSKMLKYDPANRIPIKECISHPFFKNVFSY